MSTQGSNRIVSDEALRGETAYIYALKNRAKQHHCLAYGTFSADMERLETLRREYSRRVKPITHVPMYVKAAGLAVERTPEANALLFRKIFGLRIVRFEQVDVNLPITRRLDGRWITFIGTVRKAPRKTLAEIQEEITHLQRCRPEESPALERFLRFDKMPLWQARLAHWWMRWSPEFYVGNAGTCGITLAEGEAHEYGFTVAPTTAVFGIGGVRPEPVVRKNRIEIARVMKGCLMLDNFVLPGIKAARLLEEFKALLESGSFVEEELAITPDGSQETEREVIEAI